MDADPTVAPGSEGTSDSLLPKNDSAVTRLEGAGTSSGSGHGEARYAASAVTAPEARPDQAHPFTFFIEPEPLPEEASAITTALITVLSGRRPKRRTDEEWAAIRARRAIWQAARRPRPTPHLLRGIEPSTAWKLSGLIGKPFGR